MTRRWLPVVGVVLSCFGTVSDPDPIQPPAVDGGPLDASVDDSGVGDGGAVVDAGDVDAGDAGGIDAGVDAGFVAFDAGVAPSWADGGALGSFANDRWVPGRASNGVVNQLSWESVPRGRWVEVEGTRLDNLDSEVKAAVPGWRDWGVEGWEGVTNDWNGLTIDERGSRVWLIAGGGHAGSSNNGIYEFNAMSMKWVIEHLPSDPAPWSQNYRSTGGRGGTFSVCAESVELQQQRIDAGVWSHINDAWYDELFWDKKPTSRHTYSAHAYLPDTNELVISARGQRLWRYSLTTHQWTYRRVLEDGRRQYDGAGTYAFYDEVRQEYLHGGAADGHYRSVGYNMRTNEWVPWGSPWSIYVVADTRFGREITAVAGMTNAGIYAGQYWRYNLDSRTVTAGGGGATLQFGAGLSRSVFPPENWYYDGAGLSYIPPLNEYWYWHRLGSGAMQLFKIDPTTTPWTILPNPTVGAVPNPHQNHMRKTVYLPALNAVVLVDRADHNVVIYRF